MAGWWMFLKGLETEYNIDAVCCILNQQDCSVVLLLVAYAFFGTY